MRPLVFDAFEERKNMVCEFVCYYDSDSPIGKACITHYLLSFFFLQSLPHCIVPTQTQQSKNISPNKIRIIITRSA